MKAQEALNKVEKQIKVWKSDSYSHERNFANGKVAGLLFAKELLEKVIAEEAK